MAEQSRTPRRRATKKASTKVENKTESPDAEAPADKEKSTTSRAKKATKSTSAKKSTTKTATAKKTAKKAPAKKSATARGAAKATKKTEPKAPVKSTRATKAGETAGASKATKAAESKTSEKATKAAKAAEPKASRSTRKQNSSAQSAGDGIKLSPGARAVIGSLKEGELAEKTRVHQLARLIGHSSKELISLLGAAGITVKSPQSNVTREQVVAFRDSVISPEISPEPETTNKTSNVTSSDPQLESEQVEESDPQSDESFDVAIVLGDEQFDSLSSLQLEDQPTSGEEDTPHEENEDSVVVSDLNVLAGEVLDADIEPFVEDGPAKVTPPPEVPFSIPVFIPPAVSSSKLDSSKGQGVQESKGSNDSQGSKAEASQQGQSGADQTQDHATEESHTSSARNESSDKAQSEEDDSAQSRGVTRRRRRGRRGRGGATEEVSPNSQQESTNSPDTEDASAKADSPVHAADKDPDDIPDEPVSIKGSTRLAAVKKRREELRSERKNDRHNISEAEFLARRESVARRMVVREAERHDHAGMVTQVAVLEDELLVEHFVTSERTRTLVGNIYLGRVQNVLPSMEAAFIDIGTDRNGVIYAGDVDWRHTRNSGRGRRIEYGLRPGDPILVQVTKDSVGHKGPRLTSKISLAGRFLVLVPEGRSHGISRKLPETERKRLKKIVSDILPEMGGAIIRTAAEGVGKEEIAADIERLQGLWDSILAEADQVRALPGSKAESERSESGQSKQQSSKKKNGRKFTEPRALYEEPNLLVKVVRDLFNEDFSELIVDGDEPWETVSSYVHEIAPDLEDRLVHFKRSEHSGADAFSTYRIGEQLDKALSRTVWLPSGGTLVIDRTEAMTVIDVNTGRFTGSGGNLEETVTRNNLEAAEEIVRQMRLRDLGGMIVVDFIDMVLPENRDLVLRRLTEALGRDRTQHQVGEVTSLGLVQITRKRLGNGLLETFSTRCEACGGRGVIVHPDPVLVELDSEDETDLSDDTAEEFTSEQGKDETQNSSSEGEENKDQSSTGNQRHSKRRGRRRSSGSKDSGSQDSGLKDSGSKDVSKEASKDSSEGPAQAGESKPRRSIEEIAAAAVIVASDEDPDEPSGADYLPATGQDDAADDAPQKSTGRGKRRAVRRKFSQSRKPEQDSQKSSQKDSQKSSQKDSQRGKAKDSDSPSAKREDSHGSSGAEKGSSSTPNKSKASTSADSSNESNASDSSHGSDDAAKANGKRRGRRKASRKSPATQNRERSGNSSSTNSGQRNGSAKGAHGGTKVERQNERQDEQKGGAKAQNKGSNQAERTGSSKAQSKSRDKADRTDSALTYEEAKEKFDSSPRRRRKTRGNSRSDQAPKREDFSHDDNRGNTSAPKGSDQRRGSKANGASVQESADSSTAQQKRSRGRRRKVRRSSN